MMKNIILHIQQIIMKTYHKPPPLGRWSIETCNNKLNNKIDLANEDHCGPCGKYIDKKFLSNKIKENNIR